MENSTPLNKSSNTSAADSDSSKPNMAPVEKRKNAGGNTGRRKLTPHPLNPNTNTLDSIDAQVKYNGQFTPPPPIFSILIGTTVSICVKTEKF